MGGIEWIQQRPGDAVHDVVYVSEVAQVPALVKELYGLALADCARKEGGRHVWPAPRPIDREKTQACDPEPVSSSVALGHELVAALGGAVKRGRKARIILLAKRGLGAGAVNAAARCVNKVFRRGAAATLEHVGKAYEVALHVGGGVFDAVPHAGLGAQVRDVVRLEVLHERYKPGRVGKIRPDRRQYRRRAFSRYG